jgi:hypothetical protein
MDRFDLLEGRALAVKLSTCRGEGLFLDHEMIAQLVPIVVRDRKMRR